MKDMKPLTVMFIIDILAKAGGAERSLYLLARKMRIRGHKVIICCIQGGKLSEQMRHEGFSIQELNLRRIYEFGALKSLFTMIWLVRKERVSAIMTYHESSDFLGLLIAIITRIPIVSSRRDMGFQLKSRHVLLYRLINRFFDKITTVSSAVKQVLVKTQFSKDPHILVIPNGVDCAPTTNRPWKKLFGLEFDDACFNICSLANIRSIKGQKDLVDAAGLVVRRCPRIRFFFVGDCNIEKNYYAQIQEQIRTCGLEKVIHFTGEFPPSHVPSLLNSMDICVSSSLSEGMSNAILESMAAGKPIVATAVGGNREIVEHGITGFLVPPADPKAMAEALLKVLSNDDLRHEMGLQARCRAESEFCIDRMVSRYEDLFQYVYLRRKLGIWQRLRPRLLRQLQCFRGWAKIFVASAIYRSGLDAFVNSVKRAFHLGKVKILCFHDISDVTEARATSSVVVPKESFDKFLRILTNNYRVVSLQEAVILLEMGHGLTEDVFALTFDDGYRGWIRHVLPECRHYHVPYAAFLSTEPLDSGKPLLYDALMFLATNTWRKVADLSPWQLGVFFLDNSYDILRFVEEVHNCWRGRPREDRNEFLQALSRYLEVSLNSHRFQDVLLDWNDVRKMDMSAITIGAHSVSHGYFPDLSGTECSWEILQSKRRLEEELGHSIDFFAYPYGIPDYQDHEKLRTIAKAGFRNAFTLDTRHTNGVLPFGIPRRSVSQGMFVDPNGKFNEPLLATELCGLGEIIFGRVFMRSGRSRIHSYQ